MLSIISAVAKNNCIGKNNKLPWHIPEDLKHFKAMTLGKTVIMGQNTYESIVGYIGGPFPGRTNVILTLDPEFAAPEGVYVYNSIEDAVEAHKHEDAFFIGGASIYRQTIDLVDTLYITHVDQIVDGDVFFPEIDPTVWEKISEEPHDGFSFCEYTRRVK